MDCYRKADVLTVRDFHAAMFTRTNIAQPEWSMPNYLTALKPNAGAKGRKRSHEARVEDEDLDDETTIPISLSGNTDWDQYSTGKVSWGGGSGGSRHVGKAPKYEHEPLPKKTVAGGRLQAPYPGKGKGQADDLASVHQTATPSGSSGPPPAPDRQMLEMMKMMENMKAQHESERAEHARQMEELRTQVSASQSTQTANFQQPRPATGSSAPAPPDDSAMHIDQPPGPASQPNTSKLPESFAAAASSAMESKAEKNRDMAAGKWIAKKDHKKR
jgi:hypothetical protein